MPVEIIMPKVDMDMTEGTLAVWHAAEGDEVTKGAALFDIETDKAAMEVEAPASGRLHNLTARPGDKVAVGTVIGWLYAAGESVVPPATAAPAPDSPTPPLSAPPADPAPAVSAAPESDAATASQQAARARATPAARAAARSGGVSLSLVPGTGPAGRIQRDDVTAHLENSSRGSAPMAGPGHWSPGAGPLHVSRRQGGGVPLVLLHGFTSDSQSWAPLEKILGAQCPLIRIDLPGHGRSPLRTVSGFADLAKAMADAFDDATRGAEAAHLIGHSLGGAIALAIADIRPRRVKSLSLIAPAGLGPEIDAAALAGIVRASRAESLAPWLRRLTATPEGISDAYARAAMAARKSPQLRACQADMADALFPDGVQAFDLRPALSRLTVPAQILWGRQDRMIPSRHALVAEGDFGIHLLSGAGHVPQIECPDRVARIVARLVAATEAAA